jgi:hypothetical protein
MYDDVHVLHRSVLAYILDTEFLAGFRRHGSTVVTLGQVSRFGNIIRKQYKVEGKPPGQFKRALLSYEVNMAAKLLISYILQRD